MVLRESRKHKYLSSDGKIFKIAKKECDVWSFTCFSPTVRAMFPAVMEGISTSWSANGTSSLLILSLHKNIIQKNYSFSRLEITQACVAEMKNYIRAVPVDVVDSSLWYKSAWVNPNKYQRTTLLVVDNLEGQSTQVILVPPPVGWQTVNSVP